ncbi:MAG: oxidoreductase [Planctomycetota bacterium]
MATVSVALVGIGGYGGTYLKELLDHAGGRDIRFVGAIDPNPRGCTRLSDLDALGVPRFASLQDFYAQGARADVVAIAAGIHLHVPLSKLALEHGSHVLVEKPLCAAVQDGFELIAARDQAGMLVGVGFLWSYREANHNLKRDMGGGRFGAPKRFKALALWPRGHDYYARNTWAGAQKSPDGAWVLDSPANNANAHQVHNLFFCLGSRADSSAYPVSAEAELYRANAITNFDTCAARWKTEAGVEVLFYASHAVREQLGPIFEYEFEDGTVTYGYDGAGLRASFADGSAHDYGQPDGGSGRKLWHTVELARGGPPALCPPEAALAQTLAIDGMQESAREIAAFPAEAVKLEESKGKLTWAAGVAEAWTEAYRQGRLPGELGVPWARPGRRVDLSNYRRFPAH